MSYRTTYEEFYIEKLPTATGDEHSFFGFKVSRRDAEELELEPDENVLPAKEYDPINISRGNLLYIPDLPDGDIYHVKHTYGLGGGYELEVKSASGSILTNDRYMINLSGILDDEGIYKSLSHEDKLMDIPPILPISDYYLGRELGRSEEFLVDLI